MAIVNLSRGGTPDFKGYMCEGQWAEWLPPYEGPHFDDTPPFVSHADGAKGQGYLNLDFPLIPNLANTMAHNWMKEALRPIKAVGDVFFTNWIPTRAFLNGLYIEVTRFDATLLQGVYVTPVAYRVTWNTTTEQFDYNQVTAFDDELTAAGQAHQLPLGAPVTGDKVYTFARLSMDPAIVPSTFGHTIMIPDPSSSATPKPMIPADAYFGNVIIGLKVTAGDADKIANLWRSNIALYVSTKLIAFEGSTQTG